MLEILRFDGKRVVIVGGSSGMGRAAVTLAVEMGASVVALDVAPLEIKRVRYVRVDLRYRDSIDAAVESVGGPVDVLLCCAGVGDGVAGIERVNFIGQRHVVERAMIGNLIPPGASIGMISSVAGLGWETELAEMTDYLDTPDFESAVRWIEAHPAKANYRWAKQAVSAYVARRSLSLVQRGIRINAIQPGPTETAMTVAHPEFLDFGSDYRRTAGIAAATPEQQALPLLFLCSEAASYITGTNLLVDGGYIGSALAGSFAAPLAVRLSGR